jgi:NADPH:quinone reductase-like Zn-dependent oxidoreductase
VRCVVINNGDLEVQERETPNPGPNDVIVAVRGAGINAADLMQRAGLYPAPEGWPDDVPGMELAGVVSAVGERVHEPLLGRRVCAIVGGGAQATHCLVPSEHLLFVPDHVSWEQAGGFPEAFTTAHDALVTQGQLAAGERVLISGATGGVGVAAVQIARALGAHVIAVTRTSEHHEGLRECGADETVTLDQVAGIDRVDVVLELVGAAHLSVALGRLNPFARVVVIGVSGGGGRVEVDLLGLMRSRATLTGSTLRSRSRKEKGEVADRVNQTLIPRWRTGELHVPVAQSFALEDVADAYAYFAKPGKFGKVVLRVDE